VAYSVLSCSEDQPARFQPSQILLPKGPYGNLSVKYSVAQQCSWESLWSLVQFPDAEKNVEPHKV
jgi:hypothetical protein